MGVYKKNYKRFTKKSRSKKSKKSRKNHKKQYKKRRQKGGSNVTFVKKGVIDFIDKNNYEYIRFNENGREWILLKIPHLKQYIEDKKIKDRVGQKLVVIPEDYFITCQTDEEYNNLKEQYGEKSLIKLNTDTFYKVNKLEEQAIENYPAYIWIRISYTYVKDFWILDNN